MNEKLKCLHCGEAINLELCTKAMDEHRVVLSLTPMPGEYLAATTVGRSLDEMAKLLKAVGKECGAKTLPLLERVETVESGEMRFHLLITNARPGESKP